VLRALVSLFVVGATVACGTLAEHADAWPPRKDPTVVEVAHVDADQVKLVEIVSQRQSRDGRVLDVVVQPKAQQFTVDFDLGWRRFDRVRITVLGAQKRDIVRYFPDLGRRQVYFDLTKQKGVDFYPAGDNMVIDFVNAHAAHILPPEGRLLFREVMFEGVDDKAANTTDSKPEIKVDDKKRP